MIVYISTFLPPSQKQTLQCANKNFNPYSAHNLSFSIFEGLSQQLASHELKVINIPPVGNYPKCTSARKVRHSLEVVNGITIETVGFSTLFLYNYLNIPYNIYNCIKKYEKCKDLVFLIYDLNINAIRACKRVLKNNPTARIVYIIPDFLEDVYNGTLKANLKMKLMGNPQEFYKLASGFVLLTEQMTDKVGKNKPYCVVEGMINSSEIRRKSQNIEDANFKILYSGMLYEKFGVKNLIEAFLAINNPNLKLQICGCGELEDYIKAYSVIDTRIDFLGMIPREEVIRYQEAADLLVNPRQPKGNFTRYSFPSKTIEYMASGTPLLMYKLPGVPSEYYEYCFYLNGDQLDVESLIEKLHMIVAMKNEDLIAVGLRAKEFIIKEKSSVKQCEKIVSLIKRI